MCVKDILVFPVFPGVISCPRINYEVIDAVFNPRLHLHVSFGSVSCPLSLRTSFLYLKA